MLMSLGIYVTLLNLICHSAFVTPGFDMSNFRNFLSPPPQAMSNIHVDATGTNE